MWVDFPWLSSLMVLPVVASIALFFCSDNNARWLALTTSVVCLVIAFGLWLDFDPKIMGMQFQEQHKWLPWLSANYHVGVDGISMPLILLTAFTNVIIMLTSWHLVKEKVAQYLAAFLIMQAMTVGVFVALDTLLFYLFWEGMLVPMYLCIGIWGGENRQYAAMKFFVYTFLGSIFMLVALIYLALFGHGFALSNAYALPLTLKEQTLIFFALLFAFAVKVPMWPVHTWLPDAHTEAPAAGSVILAALMLKVGGYGLFRLALPIVPDACAEYATLMIFLSLIAIVYIGWLAFAQKDIKRLIAYSSVAHMGFVTLGLFVIYWVIGRGHNQVDAQLAFEGAYFQMISHGFGSGALFLAFGLLYERYHTRLIASFGGVAERMPVFTAFFVLFALCNVGLPGTSGFVGEFMVILGSFRGDTIVAALAATTLIMGSVYTLSMVRRVFYGPVASKAIEKLVDIDRLEFLALFLLAVGILFLGIWPESLLSAVHTSSQHMIQLAMQSKLVG